MAISKGSSSGREACCFVLAVEEYNVQNMRCIVYEGNQEQGICCRSFAALALRMEQGFDEMNYPTPSVQKRSFSVGRAVRRGGTNLEGDVVLHRQKGSMGTFRVRVEQCLYATWQGKISIDEDDQETIPFESFLEFIYILDGMITGSQRIGQAELLTEGIMDAILLGGRYDGIRMNEQNSPDVFICGRSFEDGSKGTFAVRPMFRENHTFQGTLYWSEGRQKKNFRSFLELLFLMMSAVGRQGQQEGDI